ncbi:hypothetical protein V8G54_025530 [Vigna mungo]|uniref:Receptor-like serine/threonine-protein kinase n=1 Tax=Vigna mungo TaxID=3915 RepID=A0AAQ3RPM3_VIGMU
MLFCPSPFFFSANQSITLHHSNGNLVSSNATFELGFFSPGEKSGGKYLGIWYHALEPQTVVWVANRDHPVPDSTGVFRIAEDGHLVVEYAFKRRWSSDLEASSSSNRTQQLLDSGNLVLKEDDSETTYLWESFQHPTDTFLPGMKMDATLSLTCWRDSSNPAPGNFTFKLTEKAETRSFVVQYQSQIHWALDELDTEASSQVVFNLLNNDIWSTKTYNYSNKTVFVSQPYMYNKSRLLMNSSGEIVFLEWDEEDSNWTKLWSGPENKCDIPDYCGSFGLCSRDNHIPCKCLPGFSSIQGFPSDRESESQGCERKSTTCTSTNEDVMFLNLTNIKVGDPDQKIYTQTEAECQSFCIDMCPESQCQAYSFNISTYRGNNSYSCNIWTRPLPSLVENYLRGRDLSILVKTSDIALTAKSCEPCGAYAIPYPLRTGPNCGDPMYNNFNCDKPTGKVSFMIPGGISYPVTWIDEDSRMFLIQTDNFYSFNYSFSSQNSTDFPFSEADFVTDRQNHRVASLWIALIGHIRHANEQGKVEVEEPSGNDSTLLKLILLASVGSLAAVTCIIAFGIVWRKKKAHRASTRIQESLYESERHVKGLIGLGSLEEKDIEGIEVPFYTFASILAATDNFSDSNKLGRGGYGPVYKGKFPGGQEIAVKRLSSVSTQGLQEFKNEVILIAKLQHRNLVRLRGYCIKGDEKILLYEYMPNKSLDSFIFGKTPYSITQPSLNRSRSILLDWPMRYEITVGIARGMLYLHQDSRLRVIHRDMKTSNVLLDEEMTPKISDFGLAKIFGGKETEASTGRVMGT